MITTHSALIYAMVLSAAADGSVDDEELETISEIINVLPIFQEFEIGNFGQIAGSCIDLLSEPDGLDAAVGSAHAAANAMASGNAELADWAGSVDADARKIHLALGIFADPGNAAALAQDFARVGAVTEEPVSVNGRPATKLTLTHLKAGATSQDALDLARDLGLTDAILY